MSTGDLTDDCVCNRAAACDPESDSVDAGTDSIVQYLIVSPGKSSW